MPRPESVHPTQLELDILKILWTEAPFPAAKYAAGSAAMPAGRWPTAP